MSDRISGLIKISEEFRAIFCDVWGVLHNGKTVYQDAAIALASYRNAGGRVIMVTNSPRPRDGVIKQLDGLGVDRNVYDNVVTSGDATRALIKDAKGPIFHIGPSHDVPLFDGTGAELGKPDDAQAIVCTGLFSDETEKPEEYREQFEGLVDKGLPFICANPDLVVERGDKMIPCAGALAKLYGDLGGTTLVAGKPHKPIYDLAHAELDAICGDEISKSDIIAIGDGMPTDVAGAINNGLSLLYISAGIHHSEYGLPDNPDEVALEAFLAKNDVEPDYWMPRLTWDAA